jgi:hypothetical protein
MGDSLWQISSRYTLVRSPLPSLLVTPSSSHLKYLQEVSLFYSIHVHEAHQPYSFTFSSSIHPPPSHKHSYFTVLSFVINKKVNVHRGILMYPHCEYTLLWVPSTPSITLPYPFLPPPIIQKLLVLISLSSTCTDEIYFGTVNTLSFSFPFSPPPSSIG